jgi:PhoH-like ATPase
LSVRKNFVLDTSVLLHHEDSIHAFPGSNIIIPIEVLEEIDTFKTRHDSVGNAARYVNRFLDNLRSQGNLQDGVLLKNNQIIRVSSDSDLSLLPGGFEDNKDSRIISVAKKLSIDQDNVFLVSRDISMRVKCDSIGVGSEDYIREKAVVSRAEAYTGVSVLNISKVEIDKFYKNGLIDIDEELYVNECVVLKSEERTSALAIADGTGKLKRLFTNSKDNFSIQGISPRNKEQRFSFELLLNPKVNMVTLTGMAGSGKTLISIASAMEQLLGGVYDKIIVSRPVQSMSGDIGYLPGTKEEKMMPWIQPIFDNLEYIYKGKHGYIDLMVQKGRIEIEALTHIRGRSIPNTFFILDEAQNITIHEAKALLTRMGEGSKIVLLGDLEQIDNPHLDTSTSGLSTVVELFKDFGLSGHITLLKGERSELATYAAKIM